jgi:glycosyltransferase involved in cell wall biosynthesis
MTRHDQEMNSSSSSLAWFVIPYHPDGVDSQRYLSEAVRSIAEQTNDQWRIIIVHDPTPDTGDQRPFLNSLLAPLGDRSSVVHLKERAGPGGARNVGVDWAVARGADIIVFLDADDVCEPDRLAALRRAFDAHPRAGLTYSSFSVIDEESKPRDLKGLPSSILEIIESHSVDDEVLTRPWRDMACKHGYMSLTSTVAVRASVATMCPFPRTTASEDAHAWLRMFAASEQVVFLSERLTRYRVPRAVKGSASRQRNGDDFYWIKALVDADACFRVLLKEVAFGEVEHAEATDVLEAFWRRIAMTLQRAGAVTAAAVAAELASGRCRTGGEMFPRNLRR